MTDLNDYELQPSLEPPRQKPPHSIGWWFAGAVLMAAAGAAVYIMYVRRPLQAPGATTPSPTVAAKEPTRTLGGEAEPITVPPLDQSDPLVRTLVRALSNHHAVAAWLTTNGLIRNFTTAVANIADGATPAKQLNALRPAALFRVLESGGKSSIDPRSYNRYTTLADAVESVDPAGAARLYATLKPRIEEAFGELGSPDRRFDQVLEQAIVTLLRTPTPDGSLQVRPKTEGIGYAFADGRLENLSAAQKALLRMGPRNARIIKAKLRDIAVALGIPPDRLPPE